MINITQIRRQPGQEHAAISLTDRQERISGWRQDRLANGRALILGAGALGNEVIKNLALMGLGYMFVIDMDRIEHTNLSRAVFFRREDAIRQRYKVDVVAERAREINVTAGAVVQTFHDDLVWQLGSGVFRRVDVVLGCLDNIEARMTANDNCLLTGTPFIDGGIRGLAGNVTAVHPPHTACWTCTTTAQERAAANDRYLSCSNAIKRDVESGRVPTVQVASSIIAGFQAQEAVKVIQGLPWAAGNMVLYMANGGRPDLDVLTISRNPDCWCNAGQVLTDILELDLSATRHTLHDLLTALQNEGYEQPDILLPTRFVTARVCTLCQQRDAIMRPEFQLDPQVFQCSSCGATAEYVELEGIEIIKTGELATEPEQSTLYRHLLDTRLIDLGFPQLAFIHFAAKGESIQHASHVAELTADAIEVMGGAAFASVRL